MPVPCYLDFHLRAVATMTKITSEGKNFIIAYNMKFSVLM